MKSMPDLKPELKFAIGTFCEEIFSILKARHPRIRGIVIQLKNGLISVGTNIKGSFSPIYYDQHHMIDSPLHDYIEKNGKCVHDCKVEIDNINPNRRLRSFNIFYKSNKSVNICENRIGNLSMDRCRLFDQFTV